MGVPIGAKPFLSMGSFKLYSHPMKEDACTSPFSGEVTEAQVEEVSNVTWHRVVGRVCSQVVFLSGHASWLRFLDHSLP